MDITRRQITKIAREVSRFTVRTLRAEGIGTAEFDVIHAVRKNPGITQAEVCRVTGFDKGAVARQTARLEAKGYLTRRPNPADGRSQLLFPTDRAEALKNSKAQIEAQFYDWLLAPMEDADREEFARLLDAVYRRCKAESRAGFPEMTLLVKDGNKDEE